MHTLPWHWLKVVQGPPAGTSELPWQVPEVQVPTVQVLPAQHGCEEPPQATQVEPLQMVPVAVQLPVQQLWPSAPQLVVTQ
jgi:hypothetical protein